MAQVTITPAVVVATLPTLSCGVNFGDYFYQDQNDAPFRSLCVAAGFELYRTITNAKATNNAAYVAAKSFHQYMSTQLPGKYGVILHTPIMPVPQPTGAATALNPAISTSANRSVAAHKLLYEDWQNGGIDVRFWNNTNEPTLLSQDFEGDGAAGGTPFFYTGGAFAQSAMQRLCEDWITIRHREAATAYRTSIGLKNPNTKIIANDNANMLQSSSYGVSKRFILGTMGSSFTNPNSPPENTGQMDVLGVHSYANFPGGINDDQGHLNAIFWDEANSEAEFLAVNKGSFVSPLRWLRTLLDANGGTNVQIGNTEGGGWGNPSKTHLALLDIAQSVAACQHWSEFKLACVVVHAMTRGSATEENLILATASSPSPFTTEAQVEPGRRYYAFKEFWGRYMRLYKRQVLVQIVTPAAATPATTYANAVPCIQTVAGLSADGLTLGVMVCNLSLSTTEQVTISWGTNASGNITGFSCPLAQTANPLTAITPFGTGTSSLTTGSGSAPSIAAGGSYLFEIPLPAPPPTTPDPPGPTVPRVATGTKPTGTRLTGTRLTGSGGGGGF